LVSARNAIPITDPVSDRRAGDRGGLTVRQVASLTGLSEYNLRFYEREGLLGTIPRDPANGYRRYLPEHVVRCETLACLRILGMPLDDMRRYFQQAAQGDAAALDQAALLEAQSAALRDRIGQLQRTLDNIELKTSYWHARAAGDHDAAEAASREFTRRVHEEAHRSH
jgi:MerR family transcriptional regulator, aldehyde-responsive regulator